MDLPVRKMCCPLQAVTEYSTAVSHDPEFPSALNNRAMAYLKLGEYEAAAADCDALLQLQSDNIKGLLRRATARLALLTSSS